MTCAADRLSSSGTSRGVTPPLPGKGPRGRGCCCRLSVERVTELPRLMFGPSLSWLSPASSVLWPLLTPAEAPRDVPAALVSHRDPLQVSPDKSLDCPPAPAASTAARLGRTGFVAVCRLTDARQPLVCGSCSSGREFARRASSRHRLTTMPLPWATGRATTPREDSHLQVNAHAGRTNEHGTGRTGRSRVS